MSGRSPALLLALVACGGGPEEEIEYAPLELGGVQGERGVGCGKPAGAFCPFSDGDTMNVELGPNALNMVVPSLRAHDIEPAGPENEVEVAVGGIVMAADIEGTAVDMQSDGEGMVLWNLRVPFMTELCCYVCREGEVTAMLTDATQRKFRGSVKVRLARGACPDQDACCADADACPDPGLTLVCGE